MTERQQLGDVGNGSTSLNPPPDRHGIEARLRQVESAVTEIRTALKHLASKEDIAEVKRVIVEREASLQRWLIGILLAALSTTALALVRFFSS